MSHTRRLTEAGQDGRGRDAHPVTLIQEAIIMNTRQALAATVLALLGSSAFAGGEFDPLTGFGPVAATPRLAAKADARPAADERFDAGTAYQQAPKAASTLTRAEVRAEFLRARADGEMVSFDTGIEYARAPQGSSTLTREQVRAETLTALRKAQNGGS